MKKQNSRDEDVLTRTESVHIKVKLGMYRRRLRRITAAPCPFGCAYCGLTLWPELCQGIGPCVPPAVVEAFRGNVGERKEDEKAET